MISSNDGTSIRSNGKLNVAYRATTCSAALLRSGRRSHLLRSPGRKARRARASPDRSRPRSPTRHRARARSQQSSGIIRGDRAVGAARRCWQLGRNGPEKNSSLHPMSHAHGPRARAAKRRRHSPQRGPRAWQAVAPPRHGWRNSGLHHHIEGYFAGCRDFDRFDHDWQETRRRDVQQCGPGGGE